MDAVQAVNPQVTEDLYTGVWPSFCSSPFLRIEAIDQRLRAWNREFQVLEVRIESMLGQIQDLRIPSKLVRINRRLSSFDRILEELRRSYERATGNHQAEQRAEVRRGMDAIRTSLGKFNLSNTWAHEIALDTLLQWSIEKESASMAIMLGSHCESVLLELDKELARERLKAGVLEAKRDGKHCGRPLRKFPRERVSAMREQGYSWRDIAWDLKLPLSTVRNSSTTMRRRTRAGAFEKTWSHMMRLQPVVHVNPALLAKLDFALGEEKRSTLTALESLSLPSQPFLPRDTRWHYLALAMFQTKTLSPGRIVELLAQTFGVKGLIQTTLYNACLRKAEIIDLSLRAGARAQLDHGAIRSA